MDHEAVYRLRKAVDAGRQAAGQARLDNCDVGDIDDALDAMRRRDGARRVVMFAADGSVAS